MSMTFWALIAQYKIYFGAAPARFKAAEESSTLRRSFTELRRINMSVSCAPNFMTKLNACDNAPAITRVPLSRQSLGFRPTRDTYPADCRTTSVAVSGVVQQPPAPDSEPRAQRSNNSAFFCMAIRSAPSDRYEKED